MPCYKATAEPEGQGGEEAGWVGWKQTGREDLKCHAVGSPASCSSLLNKDILLRGSGLVRIDLMVGVCCTDYSENSWWPIHQCRHEAESVYIVVMEMRTDRIK